MNKEISFENTLARLEEIIKILEQGTPELDELMSLFEEGIQLTKVCQKKLQKAENRISTLIKNADGFKEVEGIKSR